MSELLVFAAIGAVYGLVHYGAIAAYSQDGGRATISLCAALVVMMVVAVYQPLTIVMLVCGAAVYMVGLITVSAIWAVTHRTKKG